MNTFDPESKIMSAQDSYFIALKWIMLKHLSCLQLIFVSTLRKYNGFLKRSWSATKINLQQTQFWKVTKSKRNTERQVLKLGINKSSSNLGGHPEGCSYWCVSAEAGAGQLSRYTWREASGWNWHSYGVGIPSRENCLSLQSLLCSNTLPPALKNWVAFLQLSASMKGRRTLPMQTRKYSLEIQYFFQCL